ncbi:MAG: MBL fold metallo-hydrolase [Clostridia bacterium]|nr:MBL fold metallo-hydrolase [Clostridia bacterium]
MTKISFRLANVEKNCYNHPMRICNLSSGSDGNLTYIECEDAKLLVDIGLSCREVEMRLRFLNVDPADIDAILITHEHSDHIKGLEVFASRYKTTVYVHERGYIPLLNKLKRNLNIQTFEDVDFFIGSAKISTVPLPHDVARCTGYSIQENEKKISIITDLGHTTNEILQNLFGSSLVFLEANHDVARLRENKNYPSYLKNRILGQNGHLSNDSCAEAIVELAKNGCRQVVLSHLSTENNTPELAYDYITKTLKKYGIIEGENIKIDVAGLVPKAIFRL